MHQFTHIFYWLLGLDGFGVTAGVGAADSAGVAPGVALWAGVVAAVSAGVVPGVWARVPAAGVGVVAPDAIGVAASEGAGVVASDTAGVSAAEVLSAFGVGGLESSA